jgi:two-component system NarL family sensor kinase
MEDHKEIVFIVLAGTSIMLTLIIVMVFFVAKQRKRYLIQQHELESIENERKQEILRAVVRTQEEERSRIATSLHDSIGAELSMLKLNLSKYVYFMKKNSMELEPLKTDIKNLDNTIQNLRSICRDLYPFTLQNYGFIKTFEDLMVRINETQTITCKYKINLKEEELFSDLNAKLNLLRLIQEVTNNLIKYADCTYLDIGFVTIDEILNIVFKHNGTGFSNEDVKKAISENKGVGLFSINNRIDLMEGKIDYFRTRNGSEIVIKLPVHGRKNQNNNS